jgi:eukaryotic-like serine/threonine-protein kinase
MSLRIILQEALSKESPAALQQFLQEAAGEDYDSFQELLQRLRRLLPSLPERPDATCNFPPTELKDSQDALLLSSGPVVPTVAQTDATLLGGKYKLRERLGTGGMGEVYAAEQFAPVRRRVAVKIIKAGTNSRNILSRFEQERQALALMDHPNIARILDGGSSPDGQPYFVMEYVKGLPITRFCDQERLSPRERLELFLPVCHAVQHAHQKGIIHRDVKPSNILVGLVDDKPVPKVIDFGISKAMHGPLVEQSIYTELNTVIGTLEYMSPEQAEFTNLDIDTRADVYSLGVILYELLAGVLPFSRKEELRGGLDSIVKIIREVDPPKPSTKLSTLKELPEIAARRKLDPQRLRKLLSGELDWIVMKCLEKERDRRYGTAASLASDLERYLHDEPVQAAPPSKAYRVKKLLKRHKGKAVLLGVVFLVLLASIAATTLGMIHAIQAEQQAEQDAATHRALLKFIESDVFTAMDVWERAKLGLPLENEIRLRSTLDRAAQQLDQGRFQKQPLVEASMRVTLGKAYKSIGAYEDALRQSERADQLRLAHLGNQHPQRLEVLEVLGSTLCDLHRFDKAETALNQLLKGRTHLLGSQHVDTLKARYLLCSLDHARGKLEQARDQLVKLVEDQSNSLGPQSLDTLISKKLLAATFFQQGKMGQADPLLTEVVKSLRDTVGPEHPDTLAAMNLLAGYQSHNGDYSQAELTYRQLIDAGNKVLGREHPYVMLFKNNLAVCLLNQKKYEQAEPLFRNAIPVFERIDPQHRFTLVSKNNLARVRLRRGDCPEAIRIFEAILPGFEKEFGETHSNTWNLLLGLVQAYYGDGHVDKGMATAERLLAMVQRQPDAPEAANLQVRAIEHLCQGHLHKKQPQEAEKLVRQQMELFPKDHPQRQRLEKLLVDIHKAG